MKYSLDISNFPEEVSSLPHSIVFLYSLHCSFKKAFLCPVGILWFSAFSWVYLFLSPLLFASLVSQLCKASSDNHFAFLHFSFFGIVLVTAYYTVLRTSVHSFSFSIIIKSRLGLGHFSCHQIHRYNGMVFWNQCPNAIL